MKILGIASGNMGTDNQIRGVILEGAKNEKTVPVTRNELLMSLDGKPLLRENYSDDKKFNRDVNDAVDRYLQENNAPDFVVLPVNHSSLAEDNKKVDLLSKSVKDSFAKHGYNVKTMAITSNLYDYENVDLIHVGKHLLTEAEEKKISSNPRLKSRVVETLGVPSNISQTSINALAGGPKVKGIIDKYKKMREAGKKIALFSLGGKTDNGQISFTMEDAQNLLSSARVLKMRGYEVIFTNSPRTPNEVTDYLYENCPKYNIEFYNSKKVATNEQEKANFRNYDGKHKEVFSENNEKVGNIYPAILSVCDFVVNTHDSFSYTSDAAAIGIPSVVYTGNNIDKTKRNDCYKLFELCHEEGYVLDLKEAMAKVAKKEQVKTVPMSNVSSQLVRAMTKHLANTYTHSKHHGNGISL